MSNGDPRREMDRAPVKLRERLRATAAEAMLDSAERAMVRKGYEQTTMQEIAAAAGCATGTFYLYFKNKEVLFNAIVDRHAQAMFDAARQSMQASDEPLEKLRLSLATFLRYVQQHKPFFRLFFTAMPMRHRMIHQKLQGTTRQRHEEYNRHELEVIRSAQAGGQLRGDFTPETIQEFMEAVCFSIVERMVFGPAAAPFDEYFRMLWELIGGGIGVRSRT